MRFALEVLALTAVAATIFLGLEALDRHSQGETINGRLSSFTLILAPILLMFVGFLVSYEGFFLHGAGYVDPETALSYVTPGSSGEVAGFRVGDKVTAVDGKATTSWIEVRDILRAGKPFAVQVQRNGAPVTIQVPALNHAFDIRQLGIYPELVRENVSMLTAAKLSLGIGSTLARTEAAVLLGGDPATLPGTGLFQDVDPIDAAIFLGAVSIYLAPFISFILWAYGVVRFPCRATCDSARSAPARTVT